MYEIMFYGGLALFILGFVISVVLFVRHDVGKIMGELIRGGKAMKTVRTKQSVEKQTDSGHSAKKSDWPEVFQMEEDITVLAGEYFSQMPTTVLRKGDIFKLKTAQKGRAYDKTAFTNLLRENEEMAFDMQSGDDMFSGDETGVLQSEDEGTTDVLSDDGEITDVLQGEDDRTDVLQDENDRTDTLQTGDNMTDVLVDG